MKGKGKAGELGTSMLEVLSKGTLVTGVIGSDTHIVGNRILSRALDKAGFTVITLGALTPANEFIEAAIETDADAILISSLYGQGELDCRGFPDLCIEAGIEDVVLYVGGYLMVGDQPWEKIEKRFKEMGFHRVFSPNTRPNEVVEFLEVDIREKKKNRKS